MRASSWVVGSVLVLCLEVAGVALGQHGAPSLAAAAPGAGGAAASSLRTETRAVASFHRIVLSAIGNLEVRQGSTDSLTITADERVLPEIVSQVSGDTLELNMRSQTGP